MKFVTRLLGSLWGVYTLAVFLIFALLSLIIVTIVPGIAARRWMTTLTVRALFLFTAIPVDVRGLDKLPAGHSVVVANHASYIDGLLLKGFLPARYSFVIKGEMRNIPIVHFLLRRSGSRFVERFTAAGSTRDARQIVKAARGGQSLAFFPEGTFIAEPGVGRFRPGAFVAATRGGMPIVAAAISGTRKMLPAGRFLPRPGRLRIDIVAVTQPEDPAFEDHRLLAEHTRQQILGALDEPDLL